MIDFRSDTVTKPGKEMLEFMFQAELGDDVFEEDPTVNALQNYAADLFGKEDALFCSSGTQTNQIAINLHTTPGGEVICHKDSHIFKYEGGGIAKNSGASTRTIEGLRGHISANEIGKWINPANDPLQIGTVFSSRRTNMIGTKHKQSIFKPFLPLCLFPKFMKSVI